MKLPEIQTPDTRSWLPRAAFPPDEEYLAQAAARAECEQRFRQSWNEASRRRLDEGRDATFRAADGTHLSFSALPQLPEESAQVAATRVPHAAQAAQAAASFAVEAARA